MKFALIVGVTLLGLLRSFVYSQDDNVFHEAQNALALVPSLSYRVQTYEQDAPKASSTLEWHEWKDSYRFLFQQFDGIQNETLRTEVSYDGKAVMTSTDGGRTVYVEEGVQKPLPDYIRAQQMLLAPFDFVLNSAVQHYWETPCLQHLQSREVWTTLMTRCKLMPDEEVGDKRLKVVEVKGGREKFSGVPISYKVYLDVDTKFEMQRIFGPFLLFEFTEWIWVSNWDGVR